MSRKKRVLNDYFETYLRERAICEALKDGYTRSVIAQYLNLKNATISKILKNYEQKVALFNKLKEKGVFWSYSQQTVYDDIGTDLMVEYLLKYGDFNDIRLGFKLFGKRLMRRVWEEKLKDDQQFIKLNLMLARLFFGMDVESSYFKEVKNARFEKLKLLAS